MKKYIILLLLKLIISNQTISKELQQYSDYVITTNNDTIYGTISWKKHIAIFLENSNGKTKYRADKLKAFHRGAFKYVSIDTEYPEFLREIISGKISYYIESPLKSNFTIDYIPKSYIVMDSIVYDLIHPNHYLRVRYTMNINTKANLASVNGFEITELFYEYQGGNFKSIIDKSISNFDKLYKMVKNGNYKLNDIECIIKHYNSWIVNKEITFLNTNVKRNYSKAYIITNNLDTIYGQIKNDLKLIAKNKIKFITQTGEINEYKANQIKGFFFNDKIYKSLKVSNNNFKDQFFLQIINGKISLFADIDNDFYIKKGDDIRNVDKADQIIDLFEDKVGFDSFIRKNIFRRNEIENIVLMYNNAP